MCLIHDKFTESDRGTGSVIFKSGESQAYIYIPLINDPTGVTRNFTIHLDDVIDGRDKIGSKTSCRVIVANKARMFSSYFIKPISTKYIL